jgi:hypothetical protein
MPRHYQAADALPVKVPQNVEVLTPVMPARVRRLRENLVKAMRDARAVHQTISPYPPTPAGFAARVARAACSLCKGWCCRNGGDDAFLDDQTIARVRNDVPELDARALLRLYLARVPALAYEGSCIFHGSKGCTLDRSLRSDLCNSYFCRGLGGYLKSRETGTPIRVFAGEGDKMRTSPIMGPARGPA